MTEKELDTYYIKVAQLCSENSKAERLKVGSILVKGQQIISDGFNGTPKGFENNCEYLIPLTEKDKIHYGEVVEDDSMVRFLKIHREPSEYKLKTKDYVLHAEANCLTKAMRIGSSTDKATLYVTHAPCIQCSKLIIQSGVERVVYLNDYKTEEGIDLLRRANIKVEKYEPKDKDRESDAE